MNGRRPRRWVGVASTACALAIMFMIMMAAPASAHATLVSSSPSDGAVVPTAPTKVTLTFDEAVRPEAEHIRVLDPSGTTVSGAVSGTGPHVTIALRPSTAHGTYTVSWRVVSADSHPVGGAITFSVGERSEPAALDRKGSSPWVSVPFGVARFLAYAGFAAMLGAVALCCYGLPRAAGGLRVRTLTVAGWAALVVGTFGALLFQGPDAAQSGLGGLLRPRLLGDTLGTTYGTALAVRLVVLGALPAFLAYALTRLPTASTGGRRAIGGVTAGAAVVLAGTWSVGGHAATGSQPWATIPADIAHLCAMAAWLGGLATVVVTLRRAGSNPDEAAGVRRFSLVAACSVTVLAVTGVYRAVLRIAVLPALFTTEYGLLLLAKVSVVCAILTVAFFSRRTLHRHTVSPAAAKKSPPRRPPWSRRRAAPEPDPRTYRDARRPLRRLVMGEAIGAVLVLAATTVLVHTRPAAQAYAAKPVSLTAHYDTHGPHGRGTVGVRLPGRTRGLTKATVTIRDAHGAVRDVPEVDVAWTLGDIGPITANVAHTGTGRYRATGAPLTSAGDWRLAVTVRTDKISETTVGFTVSIR